jgi:hypothetical protein
MAYNIKKVEEKENQEFSNLCSVQGCNQLWSVHISGQKPMCSKHQWSKAEKRMKPAALPKVESGPAIDAAWWNKEF